MRIYTPLNYFKFCKCFRKQWIVTLYKSRCGHRLLPDCWLKKKKNSFLLAKWSPVMHYRVSSEQLLLIIPGMKPPSWTCSSRSWWKSAQSYDRRADSHPQKLLQYESCRDLNARWGRRVTQVSGRRSLQQRRRRHQYWISFHPRSRKCRPLQSQLRTAAVPLTVAPRILLRIAQSSWGSYFMLLPAGTHGKLLYMGAQVLTPVCCRNAAPALWT